MSVVRRRLFLPSLTQHNTRILLPTSRLQGTDDRTDWIKVSDNRIIIVICESEIYDAVILSFFSCGVAAIESGSSKIGNTRRGIFCLDNTVIMKM